MNTRLQVEHPVTEMVTGMDLVKWQIRVAAGLAMDFRQDDIILRGHAIECRINAEDPRHGFRPSCGTVSLLHIPGGPWVRFDTALYQGYRIPPFYDSMVGKPVSYTHLDVYKRQRVFPVNYNCPGQTVVSGVPEQLAAFEADVAAARGRAVRLKVGGAFHSPFMEEAARGIADYTAQLTFAAPRIPLYANTNAEPYGDAAALLALQAKTPVRWQRTIERLIAERCV